MSGTILAGKARQLKSSAFLWTATILWTDIEMATSQRTEKEEPSVERALEQIADIEVEAEGKDDPLEGLGNRQIAENLPSTLPRRSAIISAVQSFS